MNNNSLQEISVLNCLDEGAAIISRSLRNLAAYVKLNEIVLLKNYDKNQAALAEVIAQDSEWLTHFKIIKLVA